MDFILVQCPRVKYRRFVSKGSREYDPSIMEKLRLLQRWYKRRHLRERLLRLVSSSTFLSLYYQPGNKGHWLAVKEAEKILDAM